MENSIFFTSGHILEYPNLQKNEQVVANCQQGYSGTITVTSFPFSIHFPVKVCFF